LNPKAKQPQFDKGISLVCCQSTMIDKHIIALISIIGCSLDLLGAMYLVEPDQVKS